MAVLGKQSDLHSQYVVDIDGTWETFAHRWQRLASDIPASPFQTSAWLDAWYATLGRRSDIEPVLVAVRRRSDNDDVLLLPLVRRRSGPLQIIEFADLWVTDYCAPRLGHDAPVDAGGASQLLADIERALQPADLLVIDKMPLMIGDRPNPLALSPHVRPCVHSGHWVQVDGTWDAYIRSLEKGFRKELGRSQRLLESKGRLTVRVAANRTEAHEMLNVLDQLQRSRLDGIRIKHPFAAKEHRDFYRELVERGLDDGSIMVCGIAIGDAWVACSLGVVAEPRFTFLRFGFQANEFDRIGLGRFTIEQTMKLAYERGCRLLDLSVGATDVKRRFRATPVELCELTQPLSWAGASAVCYQRARRQVASIPLLRTIKERLGRLAAGRKPRALDPQHHRDLG